MNINFNNFTFDFFSGGGVWSPDPPPPPTPLIHARYTLKHYNCQMLVELLKMLLFHFYI